MTHIGADTNIDPNGFPVAFRPGYPFRPHLGRTSLFMSPMGGYAGPADRLEGVLARLRSGRYPLLSAERG